MGVLGKVYGAIRDIINGRNIVNSVQCFLFVNGKSALDVIGIMVFQHNCQGQGGTKTGDIIILLSGRKTHIFEENVVDGPLVIVLYYHCLEVD